MVITLGGKLAEYPDYVPSEEDEDLAQIEANLERQIPPVTAGGPGVMFAGGSRRSRAESGAAEARAT